MPNLHRLMESGAVGLMPVAAPSDSDPNRTWATLSAGKGAVAGPEPGSVRPWGKGGVQLDLGPVREANAAARTGAEVGMFGSALRGGGFSTAVLAWDGPDVDRLNRLSVLALADGMGRVDGGQTSEMPGGSGEREAALTSLVGARHAVPLQGSQRRMALVAIGGMGEEDKREALQGADDLIAEALALLSDHRTLVVVLSPVAPANDDPDLRSLGPIIVYDTAAKFGGGILSSPNTRWPGIVTPADVAPSVLNWLGIHGLGFELPKHAEEAQRDYRAMDGRPMQVVPAADALSRIDALGPLLTDRHRLRVVVGEWYAGYGLVVVLLGLAVAFAPPGRVRFAAGPALALALVPAGLALAALVPPGRDGIHLAVTGMVAAGLAFVGTRSRKPERGLAAALLIAAALIAGDTVSGSWLMRRSALEMGVVNGLRFYGIGNEFMGCLVGMAVVGAAALAQFGPRGGRAAAVIGAAVVLVIGAPFWGANWGGAVTAAAGFASLWLLTRERIRLRHVGLAAAMLAAGALAPAGLDLLRPESARSHIGASAAALLAGRTGELGDVVARKLVQNYGVLRQAPWSPLAAALCAGVFWALLRRGGAGRRALEGKRWLAMGIWASLIAGLVAMVVNDSGVAAGFGCILAALGAAVFAAARPEEVAT